jgi:hypothetical protein
MVVDLAMGDFKPHERSIDKARAIQLEIVTALEQEQLKAETSLRQNNCKLSNRDNAINKS